VRREERGVRGEGEAGEAKEVREAGVVERQRITSDHWLLTSDFTNN
jgi:hypothetical protein